MKGNAIMKIQLLGIAFILSGISWLLLWAQYADTRGSGSWGLVIMSTVGFVLTVFGTIKRDKKQTL